MRNMIRHELAAELHARPFPVMSAPAQVECLAFKKTHDAERRDVEFDRAHLAALLQHFDVDMPDPAARHFSTPLGEGWLKWEQHTEFVTFMYYQPTSGPAFGDLNVFAPDWIDAAPTELFTRILCDVQTGGDEGAIDADVRQHFVAESCAASWVLDQAAAIVGDFQMDDRGAVRFSVHAQAGTGPQRIGRIVQRLCELEVYTAMSMLGLTRARALGASMNGIERRLSVLTEQIARQDIEADAILEDMLALSGELETLIAQNDFRFSATKAYEGIVLQRVQVLRESRFLGRQSFAEFMSRRFDPAMRTVEATRARLTSLTERATRAARLLQTKVDVTREAQNQQLLQSMDRRADQQLHLQRTVEGLSVVAISYYAVNLALYTLYPWVQLSKPVLAAIVTPVVIAGVYLALKRLTRGAARPN